LFDDKYSTRVRQLKIAIAALQKYESGDRIKSMKEVLALVKDAQA
jgi:hypothetical protein